MHAAVGSGPGGLRRGRARVSCRCPCVGIASRHVNLPPPRAIRGGGHRMKSSHTRRALRKGWSVAPREDIYQALTTEEDKERTNVHYEQPPRFFTAFTGGEWNTYSCNLWDHATSVTESQEAKLDLLARHMELEPGMRIMDVGCGW